MTEQKRPKRAYTRFPAEPNTLAWLITDVNSDDFRQGRPALVVDESHKGCSLVMRQDEVLKTGQKYRLLVGRSAPINAELRWMRELESGIMRLGFEYLA